MVFDYFYEEQSESYSFYRIPKMLFTEEIFEALSTDAKVLYGLLLDRISLSRENGWMDDAGRVYFYYTIKSVKMSMRCANTIRVVFSCGNFVLDDEKRNGDFKLLIIVWNDSADEFYEDIPVSFDTEDSKKIKKIIWDEIGKVLFNL